MQYKDYYKDIGVKRDASQDEIKKAYRELAKLHHPDKNKDNKKSEEKFKEITEAFEVLKDPEKRKKYDEMLNQPHFNAGQEFNPSQYGYKNTKQYNYSSSSDEDYSDFFNMFFSGRHSGFDINDFFGGQRTTTAHTIYDGENIEAEIEITPEEGAAGGEKKISLQTHQGTRNFTFKIPKGVRNGEKIRLKGQGYSGEGGGQSGDLHLIVRMKASAQYTPIGDDLEMSLDIFPWDSALGSHVRVDTLSGSINVKIPENVQAGSKIRVAGRGYPARNKHQGDLYIKVRIINPKKLSSKMKELYMKMKDVNNS